MRGSDSLPRLGQRWSVEAWPRQRAAAGDDDRGGATVELGGGPELGKKGKGGEGILLRPLPWAEVARGSLATKAGGNGRRRSRQRAEALAAAAMCGVGAERLVELKGDVEGLFIVKGWWWSGRGVGGDRRAARRALMAFGRSLVS